MAGNPFEAPESSAPLPGDAEDQLTAIYSPANVAGTTFLGSPIAGSILVLANAYKLGGSMVEAGLYCGGFCIAYVVMAMVLPEQTPGIVFALGGTFAMRTINQTLFEAEIGLRQAEGGPWAPWWHGLLVGLAVVIPFVMLFAMLLLAIDAGY